MKKLLLLLLITNFVSAQDLKQNLKEFKSITISSDMDVELIVSDSYKIEVYGNDVDKLTIDNKGHELKLTTSLSAKFKSDLKTKIYYKPGIRYIKLSNNVKITSADVIQENFLELELINNVRADLKLNTVDFIAKLELGSDIVLNGVTESQKIEVLTKSNYNAYQLKSKKAYVKVNASNAFIFVSEFLEANSRIKGEISYKGNPFSVSEKTFLGKVIRIE